MRYKYHFRRSSIFLWKFASVVIFFAAEFKFGTSVSGLLSNQVTETKWKQKFKSSTKWYFNINLNIVGVSHPWCRCLGAGEFLFGSSVSDIFVDSQIE